MSNEKPNLSKQEQHPIKQFLSRIDRLSKEQDEEDFAAVPKELLKYDVVPLLTQMAKLWHDHATWSSSRAKETHDFIVTLAASFEAMKADLVSLAGVVEELRENQSDAGTAYETQFTVEDAETFEKYVKASMAYIANTPDSDTKTALLERGQQLLILIEQNVLTVEEEDTDDDDAG